MRLAGISHKEIARKVNVSAATTCKYAKKVPLSDEARRRLLRKITKNQAKFTERFAKQKDVIIIHKRLTLQKVRSDKCTVAAEILRGENKKLIQEFMRSFSEDEGSISYDGWIRARIKVN